MRPAGHATITTEKSKPPVNDSTGGQPGLVWDIPTRGFHWLLALSLCASWATAEAGFEWIDTHNLLGYFALSLVLFRILWGIAGTRYARFSNFLRGPKAVFATLPKLFSRTPPADIGHNPIGGWSVIAFLVLVGVQAGSGIFISDDVMHVGPYNHTISSQLADYLASIHHLNFNLLQAFVVLHVAAIAWYRFGKGARLVGPMISGRKNLSSAAQAIPSSALIKGLILFGISALAVTALIQFAPEPVLDEFFF